MRTMKYDWSERNPYGSVLVQATGQRQPNETEVVSAWLSKCVLIEEHMPCHGNVYGCGAVAEGKTGTSQLSDTPLDTDKCIYIISFHCNTTLSFGSHFMKSLVSTQLIFEWLSN